MIPSTRQCTRLESFLKSTFLRPSATCVNACLDDSWIICLLLLFYLYCTYFILLIIYCIIQTRGGGCWRAIVSIESCDSFGPHAKWFFFFITFSCAEHSKTHQFFFYFNYLFMRLLFVILFIFFSEIIMRPFYVLKIVNFFVVIIWLGVFFFSVELGRENHCVILESIQAD